MSFSSWMKGLADKTRVLDIFLPMAHNTGTCRYSGLSWQMSWKEVGAMLFQGHLRWDQCQNSGSVRELLNIGVRVLDLRLAQIQKEIFTCHSFVACNLEPILQDVADFLQKNSSEAVIILFAQGLKSLGGTPFVMDNESWNEVGRLIEAKNLNIEALSNDSKLGEIRGSVCIVEKNLEVKFSGCSSAKNLTIQDSWPQAHSSEPEDFIERLSICIPDFLQETQGFRLLQTQLTPDAIQIKATYMPYLWLKKDSRLRFTSLRHLHREIWPKIKNDVLPRLKRGCIVGLDFADEVNVTEIINLNQI